jgi:hypothetical protein
VRKVGLLAMGALLVSAAFAPSVSAAASAGGSCGYRAGSYGLNTLGPRPGERNVSTGFAQATYSGVTPGTHVRVMSYAGLDDDLSSPATFGGSSDLLPPRYTTPAQVASSSSGTIDLSVSGIRGSSDMVTLRVIADGEDIGGFECAIVST